MDSLDNPIILQAVFYPRGARPDPKPPKNMFDGVLPVAEDVVLGYRLYRHEPSAPVILFFHGNGEVASDYDFAATHFYHAGASLLVVDYRGYGWSTGTPKVSTLLTDGEAVLNELARILDKHGVTSQTWIIMGRSLGSAPAIHLAHKYPNLLKGLIVESGFSSVIPLLLRFGVLSPSNTVPDPMQNLQKMKGIHLPLLILHGQYDELFDFVSNAQALYDASPAAQKTLVRIDNAGHNDLQFVGIERYFGAVAKFVSESTKEISE
jgi:pimeloyl-ACP methyl ester carboxylesterase